MVLGMVLTTLSDVEHDEREREEEVLDHADEVERRCEGRFQIVRRFVRLKLNLLRRCKERCEAAMVDEKWSMRPSVGDGGETC